MLVLWLKPHTPTFMLVRKKKRDVLKLISFITLWEIYSMWKMKMKIGAVLLRCFAETEPENVAADL